MNPMELERISLDNLQMKVLLSLLFNVLKISNFSDPNMTANLMISFE